VLSTLGFSQPMGPYIGEFHLERGRAVERACQLADEGTLDVTSVDEHCAPYVEQFFKFRVDLDAHRSIVWQLELNNLGIGLHGRIDNVRWVRGRRALLDLKLNAAQPATAYQLALYDLLLANTPSAHQHRIDDWYALVLTPTTFIWKHYLGRDVLTLRNDALALVRTYQALARLHGATS
jgi:hypothetical protein